MKSFLWLYFSVIILASFSQFFILKSNASALNGKKHFLRYRSDIFAIVIVISMTLFSALRTGYNDTAQYIWNFQNASNWSDLSSKEEIFFFTSNPLSTLLRILIHCVTDNYHVYFFVVTALNTFAVVKCYKRYSISLQMSMLIFFSIGTYISYVAAVKQCVAVAILICSIPYLLEKKYGRFYLLVFIAILFHTHAFMFAVMPLFTSKPWNKRTFIVLGLIIFAALTYKSTLGEFMTYAQSIGAMVSEDEVFDGHQINILRVAVYAVVPIIALFFRRRLFTDSTPEEDLFVNGSILSCFILSLGLVEGGNLYARMASYFEWMTPIALPWMIDKLFTKKLARIVTIAASLLYFIYFYYEFAITKNFSTSYYMITFGQLLRELLH